MTDNSTYSETDVGPYDPSAPAVTPSVAAPSQTVNASQADMNSWNAQATEMANIGGPGANAAAAQQWLLSKYDSASANTTSPYSEADVGPVATPLKVIDNTGPDTPLQTAGRFAEDYVNTGGAYAKNAVNTIADTGKSVINYIQNFGKEHQTIPAHPMTGTEMQAAKLLNVDFNGPLDYLLGTSTDPLTVPQTYKTDPLKQEDAKLDPVGYLLNKSTIPEIVKTLAYPQESTTRTYAKIQEASKLLDIVNNPTQYPPALIKKAQTQLDTMKSQANATFASKISDGFKGLIQHPLLAAQSFLDPVFLAMGELKLGDMAVGNDLASSVKAGKAARSIADEAAKFKAQIANLPVANKAAVIEKAQKYVDVYTGVAERAAANAKRLQKIKAVGNTVGSSLSGAGINAGATAIQENLDEGNVQPVDIGAAAGVGAILGGVTGGIAGHGEGEIPKTHTDTPAGEPVVKGPVTAREPGQPLPSTTPIDATKVVPYYGGVDAEGNVIHISKDTPISLDLKDKAGNPVTVPVRNTVAYHESVEHPLMHLTGPVSDAQMQLIKERMGPYAHIPAEVEAKLREGKGLSYGEAHDIATRSENHLVEQMYGVDHKVYQDALKPHIAKVAEDSASAKKEDIPANLDTKPYDNMGHPEQLQGQGNRPAQDAGQPGAGSLDEKSVGPFNAKNIGAAALTLGAAGYGAYQAGPGHRTEGTFKGLFGGMTMFGHQAIFAGRLSTDFNPIMEKAAWEMEKAGRTPEQINLATGYHRAVGGKWLHEIDDSGMRVKPHNDPIWEKAKISPVPLRDVMTHTEFERNYPKLMDSVKVHVTEGAPGAHYNPTTGNITISEPKGLEAAAIYYKEPGLRPRSIIAHELMHVVQHAEGLPRGDNVGGHVLQLNEEADNLINHSDYLERLLREEMQSKNPDQVKAKNYREAIDRIDKQLATDYTVEAIKKEARRRYNASAGESQAVNVQDRLNYDKATRRDLAPHTTAGVKFPDQRVEYNRDQSPHLQAHEMPISDHLQKTGEMDEEGKLSGMVLPEDKLPNESEVLAKAAQNDQGAIAKLYKQYMPRLIRNARGLMRGAGPRLGMDAEDLAMYVFHKAIMHLKAGSFKGDSSFYTWMHTILHNTGLNEISRAGRQVQTESMHGDTHDPYGAPVSNVKETARNIPSEEMTPEEHLRAQQTSNMVQHAISKLPQDIREAIKAYEFEGKSYEEIATEQKVPVGTVRSRLNRGRDMIEESIKRGHGANFRKQQGFATFDQMKRAALLGAGALAGYTMGGQDHHWKDAFYGALAGIGAGAVTFRGIARVVRDVRSADTLPRASSTLDKLEGSLAKLQRHTDDIQARMHALQGADSLNIAHSLEGDTSIKLTPEQQKVKETAEVLYQHIRNMAKAVGMSMQELENYTTHLFKPTEANKAIIDAFNKQQSTPLSKSSPFTRTRKLRMSLADAIAKGMELKHDNFADTFAEYYKSMLGAMHTKVAIDTLRAATDLEKRPLVTKTGRAPYGYQVINHPALRGLSVHPAIAAEMSHLFDVHTPTHLGFAYQFVNSALKRIAFMGSLFHGQTLADVQMGMSLNPYHNIKTTLQALAGSTDFQKAVKNPQPGDIVDKMLEQGLHVPSNSTGFTEDLGRSMSPGFMFLEGEMNKLFPGLGNIPKAAAAIDHTYQWIIFNRLGGGLMGEASKVNFMKLKANWIKEISKDPTKVMPSDEDLMRRAASMSSVSFGSLNWRRMANEVQNKYMRSFLMSTFSPAGRRAIQSIMLAPEWLTSTTMHWTKALFGKGEGSPIHPLNAVDLHRSWLLKSLVYSTLFGNALNYMFSGHSMMENKDEFMLDLGDGQKSPWMKELSDFPRLTMDPAQEILNKLSPTVRLIGQQLTGKEYLSAKGYSPSLKTAGDRVQNAVETMSPFSMSQNNTGGLKADISSMLGHPIYGSTPKDKRAIMMQRRQEAIKEKMDKLQRGH
ncbi:MAG: sigma-70 family RNA polymerase sigma factor [Pseudomonadota bacterium]|nr:sigma-70 family RNA polymerase sigma factor [Pseudomonadota bacterium]